MQVTFALPLELGPVRLRPAALEDASERYAGWLNDPEVVQYTEVVPGHHTVESVRNYIEMAASDSSAVLFAIEFADRGHVGNLRLSDINRKHKRAVVALLIGEKSLWRKGIASAALHMAANFAFGALALNKLTAGIYSTNPGSRAAFEKAGFVCEATLRHHALVNGSYIDIWQMAKLKHE